MQAAPARSVSRTRPGRTPGLLVATGVLATLTVIVLVGARFVEEPLRRYTERELNRHLEGYTVTLEAMSLEPLRVALVWRDLRIQQDEHPEPPVAAFAAVRLGIDWRALLRLRLVGDMLVESPRIHVNLPQLQHENADESYLAEKGWQEAFEAVYPLKVNELRITDGAVVYIDRDPERPLRISQLELVAGNIRNVREPQQSYPSTFEATALIFDQGHIRVDGHADFLRVPHLGIKGRAEIRDAPLAELDPVATHANLRVEGGSLSAAGDVEYAPEVMNAHLERLEIDGLALEYFHTAATEAAEAERLEQVREATAALANEPAALVDIDSVAIRRSTLSYVDERRDGYRLFLEDVRADLEGVSTRPDADRAHFLISGQFMGSGPSWLDLWFRQRNRDPEFQLAVEIEETELASLNDLLRAHGKFDVVGGAFSLYSQLEVKQGRVDGYIKPFFRDVDAFDRRQDAEKALFRQLYESLVGGVAALLENERDQVATRADVSGPSSAPSLSAWEVAVNLIRNAFFRAILPGFDRALRESDGLG